MTARRTLRRILRGLAIAAAALVVLAAGTVAGAVVLLQGERLGALVRKVMPPMQGQIEVRAIYWKPSALLSLLDDRLTPIVIEGVRVVDPEGTLVFEAPRLEVKIPVRSAIGGGVHLHDLRVGQKSFWRFAAMRKRDGNGFLTSLRPRPSPGPATPPPAAKEAATEDAGKFVFEIASADLDGLTAVFDFEAWGLELRDIKAAATLIVDGDFVGWDVRALDARRGGFLRILDDVLPFDRVGVPRVATTREWPDWIFLEVGAARTGRTTLRAKGFFTGIYGYGYKHESVPGIDMHAEFEDAADALTAVAGRRLPTPRLRIGGQGAHVSADLKEPFERLQIAARVEKLDLAYDHYEVRDLVVRARVSVEPMVVTVEELGFASPSGGRFHLAGTLEGSTARGDLRFDRFGTAAYLPAALRTLAGGTVAGRLSVAADLGSKNVSVAGMDLALSRTRAAGLPRTIRLRGEARAGAGGQVETRGLAIEVPGASLRARGRADLARRVLDAGLRLGTSNLPRLLGSLGVPPLAKSAAATIEVQGPMDNPRARGDLSIGGAGPPGLPPIDKLEARVNLARGTLDVSPLAARAWNGDLAGAGTLRIFENTTARMLRTPVLSFRLDGRDLDLGALLGSGIAGGRVSFSAAADGPLDRLRIRFQMPGGASLQILGAEWTLDGIEVAIDPRVLTVKTAQLSRPDGATVKIDGSLPLGRPGPMAWHIVLDDIAIESLPGVAGAGIPVAGRLSADLRIAGSPSRPSLAGTVDVTGFRAQGLALGDAHLTVSSADSGTVTVKGRLFDRFDVEGSAEFGAGGPRIAGELRFQHLKVEDLLPQLAAVGDARALLSGTVKAEWRPGQGPTVDARLREVALSMSRPAPARGGPAAGPQERLSVTNDGDIHLVVTGDRIELDEARLVTQGGALRLRGGLAGRRLDASLSGRLSLDLLQPLLRGQVEKITGDLGLDLSVAGTTADPKLAGKIAIVQPVSMRLPGVESELGIPSGVLRLAGNSLGLDDLKLSVDGATVTLRGRTEFDRQFVPTSVELDAAGEVSARLLAVLLPDAISEAAGRLRVKAHVGGTLAEPDLRAHIDFGQTEIRIRDLGRQLNIESGAVDLTSREGTLRDVRMRLDDGQIRIGAAGARPGRVVIRKFSLAGLRPEIQIGRIDLPLEGERVTFGEPGSYAIDDLGFTLELGGDLDAGLGLKGEVRVASGRYIRDFDVRNLVLSPRISERSTAPAWEGKPLLENLKLALRVRTIGDSFIIQNNLAPEIHVILDLFIGGTLAKWRIAGNVRPTDGRFHIIGVRGDFELVPNVNHINFVETKSIATGETPELSIEAQNPVIDSQGAEHNVRVRIRGPVGRAAIELSTDDGLDRNQTLLLLVTGRTTDGSGQFGTRNATIGSNLRTGTDVAGQITRDTVSSLVEPYIDDTLQVLTGRRINLRPTLGADGFEVKLGARITRRLELQLSFLQGFQAQRRYRADVTAWLVDYLTLRGFGEELTLSPQQGISEKLSTLNMELGFDYPLRLWRP